MIAPDQKIELQRRNDPMAYPIKKEQYTVENVHYKPSWVKQEIPNELCCLLPLSASGGERGWEKGEKQRNNNRVSQMSCLPATLQGSSIVAVFRNSLS